MLKLTIKIASLFFAISLSACSNSTQSEQSSANKNEDQGRAETKAIQAIDALGYDGKAIRSKVDAALDANDQRKDDLDKQIDAQTGGSSQPED